MANPIIRHVIFELNENGITCSYNQNNDPAWVNQETERIAGFSQVRHFGDSNKKQFADIMAQASGFADVTGRYILRMNRNERIQWAGELFADNLAACRKFAGRVLEFQYMNTDLLEQNKWGDFYDWAAEFGAKEDLIRDIVNANGGAAQNWPEILEPIIEQTCQYVEQVQISLLPGEFQQNQ